MIVKFSVENWKSFRNQATLSMVASRERQHGDRVSKLTKYRTRVLPIAVLYGGNASGKSNFFEALRFAKWLVVEGTRPDQEIPVEPFRLDPNQERQPSRFCFELLIDETIYELSFAVTSDKVLEEKLVEIGATTETVLYERGDGKIRFCPRLQEKEKEEKEKDGFLDFAFRGTRDNQLFLTNSVSQKVEHFRPVYDWFAKELTLVGPETGFTGWDKYFDGEDPCLSTLEEWLSRLDTGIARLDWEREEHQRVNSMLEEEVKKGKTVRLPDRTLVSSEGGKFVAKRLVTYHPRADGNEVKFKLMEESAGSQRVVDLLPAFLDLSGEGSRRVFVIDELDRSLHPLLTRKLLEAYLGSCSTQSRAQLLLTTHDLLLMDQELLRRDEIWVTERDGSGASDLFSFSEYEDVRYDKDIRKSYLQGRLGGIPRILWCGALASPSLSAEQEGEEKGKDGL